MILCATRIRLMWEQMRRQILGLQHLIPASSDRQPLEGVLGTMDAQYVLDSYHSLSIEGYRVTEGLLERVRSGNWDPSKDATDADRRNALAARGYPWVVVPVDRREEYMQALEKASVEGDITSFIRFILTLL